RIRSRGSGSSPSQRSSRAPSARRPDLAQRALHFAITCAVQSIDIFLIFRRAFLVFRVRIPPLFLFVVRLVVSAHHGHVLVIHLIDRSTAVCRRTGGSSRSRRRACVWPILSLRSS